MPLGGLMTAGLVVGGVASGAQIGLGIADKAKGKKEYNKAQSFFAKNQYEIPESAKAALGVAERGASGLRLPGEDMLRSRLGETTSGAVGASQQVATSASDVLGTLSNVYGQQQQREQDIMLMGANRYDQKQAALEGELGRMAGFEQEKWQYNSLLPYQQMLDRAGTLSGRGTAGISAGISGLGQMGANAMQVQGAQNQYNNELASMGFTQGDINPQNRMNPMQSIPFQNSLDTTTLAGQ